MKYLRKIVNKISEIVPIQDKIILESNPDLSDNTFALFRKMIDRGINDKYRIIWVHSKDCEYPTYPNVKYFQIKDEIGIKKYYQKIKLFHLFASAKYSFSSHTIHSLADVKENQFFIHLTHGFHFKYGIGRHFRPEKVTQLITLSDFDKEVASAVYNFDIKKMLNLGYPRNDLLKFPLEDFIIEKSLNISNVAYKKIILWLPTFRTHKKSDLRDGGVENSKNDLPIIYNEIYLKKLNNQLEEKNIILVIKPHPAQKINEKYKIEYSNINFIDDNFMLKNNINLYNLLASSCCLITDYSSVFFDYLLLDRPIIFTIDDFEKYLNTTGFMVESPLEFMPGHHVSNIDELVEAIDDVSSKRDIYKSNRNKLKNKIHSNQNFNSASKILDHFDL